MWGLFRGSLELVCPLCERVRELPCELEGLVLIDLVLGDQLREKSAVHATSNVVPSGYRKKRARVVVEADGVVEACRFGHLLPKALHARGAVIEPPWRSELQNRIVPGKRRELESWDAHMFLLPGDEVRQGGKGTAIVEWPDGAHYRFDGPAIWRVQTDATGLGTSAPASERA